jgi:hypothetical protein
MVSETTQREHRWLQRGNKHCRLLSTQNGITPKTPYIVCYGSLKISVSIIVIVSNCCVQPAYFLYGVFFLC